MEADVQFEDQIAGSDPAGLLPAQHCEMLRPASPPEMQLMAAVLRTAIADFRGYADSTSPSARRLFREASKWIASTDVSWPYSFVSICEVFDLDPHELRRALMRDRARGSRRRARTIELTPHGDAWRRWRRDEDRSAVA